VDVVITKYNEKICFPSLHLQYRGVTYDVVVYQGVLSNVTADLTPAQRTVLQLARRVEDARHFTTKNENKLTYESLKESSR